MTAAPIPEPRPARVRRPTATARFGSGRRESHDATAFCERFVAPELSDDTSVVRPERVDVIHRHDARDMRQVESSSVALVVTSPPYFAGKEYEESLGHNGVPGTYFEYLALLRDVFGECRRVLEPGGRIAVNVANLMDTLWKALGRAAVLHEGRGDLPLVLMTTDAPQRGSAGRAALEVLRGPGRPIFDVVELLDPCDHERLRAYAVGGRPDR